MSYDYLFKIVLVGDCGVGKTQIRNRYTLDEFNPQSKSTIGVEFAFKTVNINGNDIKGQIWDTSGEERYRAITSAYYRGSVGAILVYDVTKPKSFESMENWASQLRQYADENIVVCVVGNKIDLPTREVSTVEGERFARGNGFFYMETSALDGTGVESAFRQVMKKIYEIVDSRQQARKKTVRAGSIGQTRSIKLGEADPVAKPSVFDTDKCCNTS